MFAGEKILSPTAQINPSTFHPAICSSRRVQGNATKVSKPWHPWVQALLSLSSVCSFLNPTAAEYARGKMFMVFTALCFVSTYSLGNDKYSCALGPRNSRRRHADTTSINNYTDN